MVASLANTAKCSRVKPGGLGTERWGGPEGAGPVWGRQAAQVLCGRDCLDHPLSPPLLVPSGHLPWAGLVHPYPRPLALSHPALMSETKPLAGAVVLSELLPVTPDLPRQKRGWAQRPALGELSAASCFQIRLLSQSQHRAAGVLDGPMSRRTFLQEAHGSLISRVLAGPRERGHGLDPECPWAPTYPQSAAHTWSVPLGF